MAINITSTTQFNTFSTIKSIIKNDSILKTKFNDNNILEYEPSKSKFLVPHIVVNVPEIIQNERTFGASPIILKDVTVEITIRIEYGVGITQDGQAGQSVFVKFYDALMAALEADTTLQAIGYIPKAVNAEKPTPDNIFGDEVIEGVVNFELMGAVN